MTPRRDDAAEPDPAATAGCPATVATGCHAELGWGLSIVTRSFTQWAAESVADLPGGLRGHLVLAAISQDQPPSQLALANQLGLDRTVMTYLLDELESSGLVTRRADPADRRARRILITESGTAAMRDYRARIDAAEGRLLSCLDDDEAGTFRRAVERLARAAQTDPDRDAVSPGVGDPC